MHIHSNSNYLSYIKESLFIPITQDKRIVLIATIAIGFLAVCYMIVRGYRHLNTRITPFLDQEWKRYKEKWPDFPEQALSISLNTVLTSKSGSLFDINRGHHNILHRFEKSPHVALYPFDLENPESKEENFKVLLKVLTEAFAANKKLVGFRICNPDHTCAAMFSADGHFKVIDSMGSKIINIAQLTLRLNDAKIRNAKAQIIFFNGDYINTHLQKWRGGVDDYCQKYATLYLFQMAKTKSLHGYRQVNAAVRDNVLKTYDDIDKIPEKNELADARHLDPNVTLPFMNAWMRKVYLPTDHWEDITIAHVLKSRLNAPEVYRLTANKENFFCYTASENLEGENMQERQFLLQKADTSICPLPPDRLLPQPSDFQNYRFKDLFPKEPHEKRILIRSEKGELFWIKLFEGETLLNEKTLKDGTKYQDIFS